MGKRRTPRGARVNRTPASPAAPRGDLERWVPLVAPLAATVLIAAAIELGATIAIPGTAVLNDQLSLGSRVTLSAYGIGLTTAGICALAVPLWLLNLAAGPGAPVPRRWIAGTARTVLVWVALLLYASSWALFWNTQVFLDRQAFAFLAAMNPVQVFHWVYPPLAIGVIVGTLVGTGVLLGWLPRWIASTPIRTQRRLVLGAGAVVAVCFVVAAAGAAIHDSGTLQPNQPKSDFEISRDAQTGPAAHLVADFRRRLYPIADGPIAGSIETDTVVRRPIISMEQYLSGVSPGAIRRHNVVMVQVESLRSDQLRIYGGTRDAMPNVDALARESRVFTNAYVQASHSNYQDLVPLSSHYPLRSPDMYEYPPDPPYPRVLIYDVLKALGYRTAIFSSQNERWGGMINYHRSSSLDRFFHAENFSGPTYAPWGDLGFAEWVRETRGAGSVDDRYTVSEAIKWLEEVGDQPFFIHMNLQSSHVPYVIPEDFPHRFSPKELDFAIMWAKFPIEKVDIVKGRYADSLFYADTQIGRLFDHLKKRGLWDNSIIIIGGDNGEAFYEHGFASHASSLFNEVMKVPMVIRAPALEAGLDDRPAMFLDVPPSLFQLLGLPPHPSFQGTSLFEPVPNPSRSLYMIVQTPAAFQSAIVRSGFKLLHNELDGRYFLWDQVNDPEEKRNLVASRPDLVEDLAARLRLWRAEQLSYYADVQRQSREYPPVVKD